MSKLKITFTGFKELAAAMHLRIGKVRNQQTALKKVGEEEIRAAQERIKTSKMTPDGQPWTPWAQSTALARMQAGDASRGLLYKSGNLLNSFQLDINTNQVIVKNVAPYAAYLQEGTDNMPARPYFGWSKESKQRIKTIFDNFLQKTVVEGKDYK